jgi:hypothetical protein
VDVKCPFCPRKFKYKDGLLKHAALVHGAKAVERINQLDVTSLQSASTDSVNVARVIDQSASRRKSGGQAGVATVDEILTTLDVSKIRSPVRARKTLPVKREPITPAKTNTRPVRQVSDS